MLVNEEQAIHNFIVRCQQPNTLNRSSDISEIKKLHDVEVLKIIVGITGFEPVTL